MDEIAVGLGAESHQPFQLNQSGVAAHTAILAQTGAGKSFLLGRYLEEILLKTRAKVVILDPNSDFLRFGHPSHPEEASSFAEQWRTLPVTLLSNRDPAGLSTSSEEPVRRIVMDWSKLTPTEQCRYLNFVTALDYQEYVTVTLANRVARQRGDSYSLHDFLGTLRAMRESIKKNTTADVSSSANEIDWNLVPEQSLLKVFTEAFKLGELEVWPNAAGLASLDDVVSDFSSPMSKQRLLIADLPSLYHEQAQSMIADRLIELIWRDARTNWLAAIMRPADEDTRVPMFIVIDEAHNLVPPETPDSTAGSVKARLTRIAAEGRKYGLFLIVVTQRPSRISSDVLSQVENLFLLKLTNRIDLDFVTQTFGTVSPDMVKRAEVLDRGEFILSGRLVPQAVVLKGLPRRTEEGGRSIQPEVWMRQPIGPS